MRKIKIVVLLVRLLQHGFTKNAKVSPNLTVVRYIGPTYWVFSSSYGLRPKAYKTSRVVSSCSYITVLTIIIN